MLPSPQAHKKQFLLNFNMGILFLAMGTFQSGILVQPWLKLLVFVSMLLASLANFRAAWKNFELWITALQQTAPTPPPPAVKSTDDINARL